MKKLVYVSIAAAGLGAIISAGPAIAYTGQKYAAEAKISMVQATQIAQRAQPGQIADRELERESGGSGLRYSFDIKSGKVTHEVGVDARTGKILENSVEGPNAD